MNELTVRPPATGDVDAVVDLGNAYERAFGEAESFTRAEILDEWSHLDLAKDAWLVVVPDGRPAGYATVEVSGGRVHADGYVHPAHRGRGVGGRIVELTEARARELGASAISTATMAGDEAALDLLEGRGYRPVRHFFRMVTELGDEPRRPDWPAGIRAEPFDERHARAFHEAIEDAWRDHWRHEPRPFELFRQRILGGHLYDPTLWTVAWAEDEIAGGTICEHGVYGMGWVRSLFVRRPWRRHGLGMALLVNAFAQFQARGERRVGLGVDAQSPTGATRLYERAGMRVVEQSVVFEKAFA